MSNNPKIFGKTLKLSWSEMAVGIATSVLGLILAVCPGLASSVVFNFIGIVGIIIGAIQLIRYFTMDPQASLKSNGMFVGLMWLVGGILLLLFQVTDPGGGLGIQFSRDVDPAV